MDWALGWQGVVVVLAGVVCRQGVVQLTIFNVPICTYGYRDQMVMVLALQLIAGRDVCECHAIALD